MKRRSKQNVKFWQQLRERLYKAHPSSKLTENRYKTLKALLGKKYPDIVTHERIEAFLKDADYLNRRVRYETEGEQEELKKILSQDYQLNLNK